MADGANAVEEEVLRRGARLGRGVGERMDQAPALDGRLLDAPHFGRNLGAGDFERGRQQVDQVRDEAADLLIGVSEEARMDLRESRMHALRVGREAVPGRNTRAARWQLRFDGNEADFLLPGEGPFAIDVPALVQR